MTFQLLSVPNSCIYSDDTTIYTNLNSKSDSFYEVKLAPDPEDDLKSVLIWARMVCKF